ncbi:3-deoxy-7-phosphoheptulonate synthase [Sphingomonas rhizophila]|uniref:3-deoxy-7-phosphoheptulonate synthase n=1 Tax=Sphingomonas rhizophila TaxID=2071607 RepID=A0A7G9SAU3_9SPHN|nr:3-deoxy-7-phosphoheptulonate synthase [Sphingomonas rhizophila]QNN64968.1 3-deoxy-7-phosphoheptulonate synthase [Sphingomonas rhizophila]
MIIVMKPEATEAEVDRVLNRIAAKGLKPLHMPGSERVVLGALGDERVLAELALDGDPYVESVKPILAPYKLVSRELHPHDSLVAVGGASFGGNRFGLIAGPCAVETEDQLLASAQAAKAAGARVLRAGAYKPRTSPYAFQGHGPEALELLAQVGRAVGLPVVTEVIESGDVELVARHADALQVGARNMQNFALLKAVGAAGKPVILKRGMSARIEDLLLAAEYVLAAGNDQLILCERGIRTFETATRNTLDLAAVPVLKAKTHLPVIVDPSHGTGRRDLVAPMALAAAAAGADGLMVEVHVDPPTALSDGPQSLYPDQMIALGKQLGAVLGVLGRTL